MRLDTFLYRIHLLETSLRNSHISSRINICGNQLTPELHHSICHLRVKNFYSVAPYDDWLVNRAAAAATAGGGGVAGRG